VKLVRILFWLAIAIVAVNLLSQAMTWGVR